MTTLPSNTDSIRPVQDWLWHLQSIEREVHRLERELEVERIRLAACGVAARANTTSSAAQRLDRRSPYWSASYADVCAAVDREMALRLAHETSSQATELKP